MREMVEANERKVAKFIGPTIIETFGPFIYVAAGGTGTLRLNKLFSLQMNTKTGTLTFAEEF